MSLAAFRPATTSPVLASFPWPAPPGAPRPVWTGRGFQLEGQRTSVLSYETGRSGWTDDLTAFHEETAGSDHPIDVASREMAIEGLRLAHAPAPVVLEVGCSSGFMLRHIQAQLPNAAVIGSDFVPGPLETLATSLPDVPLLHFDLTRCPLPDGSVDAVVLLNVLEHIEDDTAAIVQVHRVLRPGGVAVIEVPAGPGLYDVYDELLMHHRRYRLRELTAKLRRAGFELPRATHLGVFIYPGFFVVKRRNQRFLTRERAQRRQVVAENIRSTASSRLLGPMFRLERWLGRWVSWPFGIRCVVAARRP